MAWNFNNSLPIYQQIMSEIQLRIIRGTYCPGEKLPSVREMAEEASVNPNTMQKAFVELERIGLVYSKRTIGRFITEDEEMIKSMQDNLIKQKVLVFIEDMNSIGIINDEIIPKVEKVIREMK